MTPASEERGATPLHVPELEADYAFIRELGRGGTSFVYLARDRHLEREVAIKLIRPGHAHDEEAVARLYREARLVGQLRHPNIVTLLGTRRLSEGSLALIMQYVPGLTLKQTIRDHGPLGVETIERVLRDVASALDYAYRRHGVVHRDVKPENIYLDPEHGTALLSDFGIARAAGAEEITLTGTALGTPAYMSPEQIDGAALDGRSDLYSLGMVAYEMATGQPPWTGDTIYSIIYNQKHEPLPPLGAVRPDLPAYLVHAVSRLIKKDPDSRWPTGADFLDALDRKYVPAEFREPAARVVPVSVGPHEGVAGPEGTTNTAARPDLDDAPTVRLDRNAIAVMAAPPGRVGQATDTKAAARNDPTGLTSSADDPANRHHSADSATPVADTLPWPAAPEPTAWQPTGPTRTDRLRAAVTVVSVAAVSVAVVAFMAGIFDDGARVTASAWSLPQVQSDAGGQGTSAWNRQPMTAPAAQPSVLAFRGDGQVGLPGERLAAPLVVLVHDGLGQSIPGATVEFHVAEGGGSIEPARARTGPDGLASAWFTLGRQTGEQRVVARVVETDATVTFRAMSVNSPSESPILEGRPLLAPPERAVSTVAAGNEPSATAASAGNQPPPHTSEPQPATPAPVSFTSGARVAAGGTHTCLLNGGGTLSCWGGNDRGQLGDGSQTPRATPATVAIPEPLATVAAGITHTCGLTTSGMAFCWGANDEGQLGDGSHASRTSPVRVQAPAALASISAGLHHTCALSLDGAAFCWGGNADGQLGDGSTTGRVVPAPIQSTERYSTIAAGWRHTCAVTGRADVHCWGNNDHGQLGNGTTSTASSPVTVQGSHEFTAIAAGATHTCGITRDGSLLCWGGNQYGQLGIGSTVSQRQPVSVSTFRRFTAVAAGALHTCAIDATGQGFCWGMNSFGQLGNGSTENAAVPVPVAGGFSFTALWASGSHTCGRTVGGDIYCWGYNVDGQLGDGSRIHQNRPVRAGPLDG